MESDAAADAMRADFAKSAVGVAFAGFAASEHGARVKEALATASKHAQAVHAKWQLRLR